MYVALFQLAEFHLHIPEPEINCCDRLTVPGSSQGVPGLFLESGHPGRRQNAKLEVCQGQS